MRRASGGAKLAAMRRQRVILDAAIERSVIRGTLTPATGARREFHGWLELTTALEAILTDGANPVRNLTTRLLQFIVRRTPTLAGRS